nr:hypothetical protein MmNV_57 [Menippe mercenaria nudivirus]
MATTSQCAPHLYFAFGTKDSANNQEQLGVLTPQIESSKIKNLYFVKRFLIFQNQMWSACKLFERVTPISVSMDDECKEEDMVIGVDMKTFGDESSTRSGYYVNSVYQQPCSDRSNVVELAEAMKDSSEDLLTNVERKQQRYVDKHIKNVKTGEDIKKGFHITTANQDGMLTEILRMQYYYRNLKTELLEGDYAHLSDNILMTLNELYSITQKDLQKYLSTAPNDSTVRGVMSRMEKEKAEYEDAYVTSKVEAGRRAEAFNIDVDSRLM